MFPDDLFRDMANGSHPFTPPIPGVTLEGVTTLRTLDQAKDILGFASPGAKAVCIGGGLLGLETAGALAGRGLDVTVLEGHGTLLPRQLSPKAGLLLQKQVERLGIKVLNQTRTEEIKGDESSRQ